MEILAKLLSPKKSQEFLLKKAKPKPNSWIPLRSIGAVVPRRWLVHEIYFTSANPRWRTYRPTGHPMAAVSGPPFSILESRWKNQVAWSIRCSNLGWDRSPTREFFTTWDPGYPESMAR